MNRHDIGKIVRWAVESDIDKFGEEAYGGTGTALERAKEGDYLLEKFNQMQTNFIMWLSGLSDKHRGRLANNITFNQEEE